MERFNGRVVLLTNFLPPYRIEVLELLAACVGDLRILLSVRMESNRRWGSDWGALQVRIQRTFSFAGHARHAREVSEDRAVHVPYDTLWQLAAYRPAAIISAEFGMRTMQAAIYRLLAPRTRLIAWATVSEITEQSRGGMRWLLRRLILQCCDAVLVNGSSGARYIRSLGYPDRRIFIVPQASDNALFAGPATRPADETIKLLYTGQLIERKGLAPFHRQLVRWCFEHPERKVSWTLVGSGPLLDTIAAWRRPANYHLRLVAEAPYRELAAYYHQADLYTLPTLADEWGLVVNEALAAGLPVLGSVYSQAVQDLVIDGANGWTFRIDHEDEVYAALNRAFSSTRETWDGMRVAAIAGVRRFDSAHMSERLCQALLATCT